MSNTKEVHKELSDSDKLKIALNKVTELENKYKNAKIIKENSDYFINEKTSTMIAYKSLSETKKYFENNNENILKAMCKKLNVEALTSKQFHKALSENIKIE